MEFNTLITKTARTLAEAQLKLADCNDMYRLRQILLYLNTDLPKIYKEADECVKELEEMWS